MPLFSYAPLPDLDAYLARIGYTGSREPNLETLNALIYAHQLRVPFENMSGCAYGETVYLDIPHVFEKVVNHGRGGYCFELNGLFSTLLRTLGFDAYTCLARVIIAPDMPPRPISHRAVIIRLDGKKYICDVGFGGAMAPFAVELSEKRQTVMNETYWVKYLEEGWFELCRARHHGIGDEATDKGDDMGLLYFSLPAAIDEDYEAVNYQTSRVRDNIFVQRRWCSLRTPSGYISLIGDDFVIMDKGVKTVRKVTDAEVPALLEQYMNIRPTENI